MSLMWVISCHDPGSSDDVEILDLFDSKEELGEAFFLDKALSLDSSISCATCHIPEKAFTDGRRVAKGIKGREGMRNTPTLVNVKNLHFFMFDGRVPTLEMQAIVPIQDTNEMGIPMKDLVKRLQKNKAYQRSSQLLFGRDLDAYVLTRSLAAFQRTITSKGSRFDAYFGGKKNLLSIEEEKGWRLFNALNCVKCHPAPDFTCKQVRNNGFMGDSLIDQGAYRATGRIEDKGSFKVPTLRNIELTAPYMHNGTLQDLDAVIDHYVSSNKHSNSDPLVKNIRLNASDRIYLKAFLLSLTDTIP